MSGPLAPIHGDATFDFRRLPALLPLVVVVGGILLLALEPGPTPSSTRLGIAVIVLIALGLKLWLLRDRVGLVALELAARAAQVTAEDRLRMLLEHLPAAVYLDQYRQSDGAFLQSIYISPKMTTLTGHSIADQVADPDLWLRLIHPDDRDRVATDGRAYPRGGHLEQEFRLVRPDGSVIWVREEARIVASPDSGRMLSHGFVVDVTERKRLEAELSRLAFHDALTGLANRALFGDRLDQAFARSQRSGRYPAVLCLDLDRFKEVNDGHGHAGGDQLLQVVGERLVRAVRPTDCVARLGGDELAILIEEIEGADVAIFAADRLLHALSEPIDVDGQPVVVGASIGIAMAGLSTASPDHLLRNGDAAMYEAKFAGRDRWVMYRSETTPAGAH